MAFEDGVLSMDDDAVADADEATSLRKYSSPLICGGKTPPNLA
jgi:hypothetical protein